MPPLHWIDDHRFEVDEVSFESSFRLDSSASSFFIRKSRDIVEDLVGLLGEFERPTIFELGVAAGGSAALMALVAEPRRLVAVELAETPVEGLEKFIDHRGLRDVVRVHYGVNQADRDLLAQIVATELGSEPIDVVVDDASHRLGPSRVSFEVLFPHLRPGGLYLIEDWNWQQKVLSGIVRNGDDPARWQERVEEWIETDATARAVFEAHLTSALQDPNSEAHELMRRRVDQAANGMRPEAPTQEELLALVPDLREYHEEEPLLTLIFELVLARAGAIEPDATAIADITLGPWWAIVRRGSQPLTPGSFRVGDLYRDVHGLLAGHPLDEA
jgi:predicted O-methyltransferase YrrM